MNVCYEIIPQPEKNITKEKKSQTNEASIVQIKESIKRNLLKINNQMLDSKGKKSQKRGNKKHWKPEENLRYCQFLKQNSQLCSMPKIQKISNKLNVKMSEFIGTKTPTQCRSHNQKMLIKYGEIIQIISGLEGKILGRSKNKMMIDMQMSDIQLASDSQQMYIEQPQSLDDSQIWNNLSLISPESAENQSA